MLCFWERILIGTEPIPGSGLRVLQGVFVNLSGRHSAKALRSRSFLTSVSTRAVLGSGFMMSDSSAQNSRRGLG